MRAGWPEEHRWCHAPSGYSSRPGDRFGVFRLPSPIVPGRRLRVLVDDGELVGWEHASVSIEGDRRGRLPSWEEMDAVRRAFWRDDECVVQYHVPVADHVDMAPVLHLWRPIGVDVPRPPSILVGVL